VLLGQDLGGRHQRGLEPRLDRGEHREHRHERLAGAHVALEEPVHRMRRGHVDPDLLPHALLGGGERERQRLQEAPSERAGRPHREAGLAPFALPPDGEAELQHEEVLEDEAAVSPRLLGLRLREVPGADRAGDAVEVAARAERLRQRLGHAVDELVDEPPRQRAKPALRHALGGRIDGHESAGVQMLVIGALDELVVLDQHLEGAAAARRLHLAVDDQALAAREDALEVALVEPEGAEESRGVTEDDGERHAGAAARGRAHPGDRPRAGARVAGGHAPEREDVAPVLVASGQVQERVVDGREADALEELGLLRPHALDELQWRVQTHGGGGVPGRAAGSGLNRHLRTSCSTAAYRISTTAGGRRRAGTLESVAVCVAETGPYSPTART
jgi:hypothetical protein